MNCIMCFVPSIKPDVFCDCPPHFRSIDSDEVSEAGNGKAVNIKVHHDVQC